MDASRVKKKSLFSKTQWEKKRDVKRVTWVTVTVRVRNRGCVSHGGGWVGQEPRLCFTVLQNVQVEALSGPPCGV